MFKYLFCHFQDLYKSWKKNDDDINDTKDDNYTSNAFSNSNSNNYDPCNEDGTENDDKNVDYDDEDG